MDAEAPGAVLAADPARVLLAPQAQIYGCCPLFFGGSGPSVTIFPGHRNHLFFWTMTAGSGQTHGHTLHTHFRTTGLGRALNV